MIIPCAMLEADRLVAEREGYAITLAQGSICPSPSHCG